MVEPGARLTNDRWDSLLDRDWSDEWETLPEAPDLVPRATTAQITLRLPATIGPCDDDEEEQDFEPDHDAMSHFDRASMDATEAMGIEGW